MTDDPLQDPPPGLLEASTNVPAAVFFWLLAAPALALALLAVLQALRSAASRPFEATVEARKVSVRVTKV